MTIVSNWTLLNSLNQSPDELLIQIPPGQAGEMLIRTQDFSGVFTDVVAAGDDYLNAINAAAGSNLTVGYRHTGRQTSGNSATEYMHVNVNSLTILLTGTATGTSDRIELQEEFPFPILSGDACTLQAGCDRTTATCAGRFGNIVNFRGEPFVPGVDLLMTVGRAPQYQ